MSLIRVMTLLGALCAAQTVWAADVERPMIEIGGGVEVQPSQGVNVLLRVSVDGVHVSHLGSLPNFVIAKIRGDLAFSTGSDGNRVPFSEIEFVPAEIQTGAGLRGLNIRMLPSQFGTHVRLNEELTVRVDIAGVSTQYLGPSHLWDRAMIYAKVAADALGYKMASHVSSLPTFQGASLASLNAEVGLVVALARGFKIRIAFGGGADLSLGGNGAEGFAVQSDLAAYNEISMDLTRFLRLFVRNGLNANYNSAYGSELEYQLAGGATFIF